MEYGTAEYGTAHSSRGLGRDPFVSPPCPTPVLDRRALEILSMNSVPMRLGSFCAILALVACATSAVPNASNRSSKRGDFVVLDPESPDCVEVHSRPVSRGGGVRRAIYGKIAGLLPNEKVFMLQSYSSDTSTWNWLALNDAVIDVSDDFRVDGTFFVDFHDVYPITMLYLAPERHRAVEILSAVKELCVGIALVPAEN
jgi:hypothetical protein